MKINEKQYIKRNGNEWKWMNEIERK